MGARRRYYKAGVREALFMLSRGRCYAPQCPTQVLLVVDDDPSLNTQIAHINGLNPGSARFDPSIPEHELNRFGNLLLLCQAHHSPVDDKSKQDKYTKKLLLSWKKEREGSSYDELAVLDVLGKEDLEQMLTSVITGTKDEILEAIDEIAEKSETTAAMLRQLVKETFDRPYLDFDAVALLADSASSLRHLPDSAVMLSDAARQLTGLSDNADTLRRAAWTLSEAMNNAGMLQSAASDLSSAFESAMDEETASEIKRAKSDVEAVSQRLSSVVADINEAARNASEAPYDGPIIQQIDHRHHFNRGFKAGAISVAVMVAIAVIVTIYIMQHNSP